MISLTQQLLDKLLSTLKHYRQFAAGCRTVSNNGSGSGLAPAQNILEVQVHLSTIFEVQVWFRFTQVKYYWFRFGSGSLT